MVHPALSHIISPPPPGKCEMSVKCIGGGVFRSEEESVFVNLQCRSVRIVIFAQRQSLCFKVCFLPLQLQSVKTGSRLFLSLCCQVLSPFHILNIDIFVSCCGVLLRPLLQLLKIVDAFASCYLKVLFYWGFLLYYNKAYWRTNNFLSLLYQFNFIMWYICFWRIYWETLMDRHLERGWVM